MDLDGSGLRTDRLGIWKFKKITQVNLWVRQACETWYILVLVYVPSRQGSHLTHIYIQKLAQYLAFGRYSINGK
jgi:hypothetical protein